MLLGKCCEGMELESNFQQYSRRGAGGGSASCCLRRRRCWAGWPSWTGRGAPTVVETRVETLPAAGRRAAVLLRSCGAATATALCASGARPSSSASDDITGSAAHELCDRPQLRGRKGDWVAQAGRDPVLRLLTTFAAQRAGGPTPRVRRRPLGMQAARYPVAHRVVDALAMAQTVVQSVSGGCSALACSWRLD